MCTGASRSASPPNGLIANVHNMYSLSLCIHMCTICLCTCICICICIQEPVDQPHLRSAFLLMSTIYTVSPYIYICAQYV